MKATHLLLLLALLTVFLFFPLRILQFAAMLYIVVLGLSYLYARILYRHVIVSRSRRVLRTHRFEAMQIDLIVENRSPFPVAYLNVSDQQNYFFSSPPGNFLISLGAGQRRRLSYPIESQQRGEYTVGPAVIQGSDPLGLFPFLKSSDQEQTLIVYPEVLPLTLEGNEGLPAGAVRVQNRMYEDLSRYRSVREYLPGDALRRVNWKASARTGELFVTDYLPLLHAPVLILLDLNSEHYPLRYRYHRIERGAALAASLVMHHLDRQQEIGLIAAARLQGQAGAPTAEIAATHEHATTLLEMLARMQPETSGMELTELLFHSRIEIPVRTRLQVITSVLTEADCSRLRQLKQKGCSVEVFLFGEQHHRFAHRHRDQFRVYSVQDFGNELVYR